jgi:hypothetical protein
VKKRWGQLVIACLVVLVATVVAASGSAGPRAATVTFEAFPGPGEVNFGEQIAYHATFANISGTTLTKVMFRQGYPVVNGTYADPVESTCPSTPQTVTTSKGREWICNFGTRSANSAVLDLLVVWKVNPASGSTNASLASDGRWTVKEGTSDVSDPNDAFFDPAGPTVTATVLAAGKGGSETHKAGGFETTGVPCTGGTGSGNLQTNPDLSAADPVSTTVCFPATFSAPSNSLGVATTLVEGPRDDGNAAGHPNLGKSDVCIAAFGENCPDGDPYTFAADHPATFVFRILDDAILPKGDQITHVYHDGFPLPTCDGSSDETGDHGCVVSITPGKGKVKIWTVIAKAETNGSWVW